MSTRKAALFVLSFLLLVALAQAGPAFSLKLYGGAGYWLTGGDFKPLFASTADRWREVGYTGTFDLDWKPIAIEGGVQAVLMFNPRLGMAFGIGYLSKSINQDSMLNDGSGATVEQISSYKVQSLPVSLDLLYYFVASEPVRINLSVGATYFSSLVKVEEHSLYKDPNYLGKLNWKWDLLRTFESDRKSVLGFQAGLGAEIKLFGPASLCFDLLYRLASFDDIQGTLRESDNVTWTGGHESGSATVDQTQMWYSTADVWGNTWHYLDIQKGEPTTVDEARPFKISMGGPVLRVGIKIGV
ncbi:MAG: outer membrane beta-barrel protein, partial [Candidatus Aminicenantes bacterium]|nr:outer membrane beta-barrel protein [Candidatus Aminicenantes bacterium]